MSRQVKSPIQQVDSSAVYAKAKTQLVVWLIVWLGALPLSLVLESVLRAISPGGNNSFTAAVNIIAILLGVWFFVGWVPVVITGLKLSHIKKPV